MEDAADKTFKYIPDNIHKLAIPNDSQLLNCFHTYHVSKETQQLSNEQGRTIFAEAFKDADIKLLSMICVEALAKTFGPSKIPAQIKKNPLELRIFYDSLSVDLPLKQSHCINDIPFWKRSLLAISKDPSLKFKKSVNWKKSAITEKLEQIIEHHSVQYFPSEEFQELTKKIKPYITHLHIKHLDSLPASHFERYIKETDSDYSLTFEEPEDDFLELSEIPSESVTESVSKESCDGSSSSTEFELIDESREYFFHTTNSQYHINKIEKEIRQLKTSIKDARAENKLKFEELRKLRSIANIDLRSINEDSLAESKLKTKIKKNYKSLFDIPLESENEETDLVNFPEIVDKRNLEQFYEQQRRYNYPFNHCHHIDLSFLKWFTSLETLCLEFQGPWKPEEFHNRHFKFSYQDVRNLAEGIAPLARLRVFRLRNSRVNAKKLQIILNTLKIMDSVQVLDFGNDGLLDDCGIPIYLYLNTARGLISLELEGNRFGSDFIIKLAYGIYIYDGPKLQYLGLARNQFSHEGFHELMLVLCNTDHVNSLNLTAALLDNSSLLCCVAHGLLSAHKTMQHINLMAVPIEHQIGVALRVALEANKTLLDLNVHGCDLEYEIEREIEVLLRRNRHIRNHDFIGRTDATVDEIEEHFKNQVHPIYARVLEKLEKKYACLNSKAAEHIIEEKFLVYERRSEEVETTSESGTSQVAMKQHIPFVFDCNKFDEKGIFKHLHMPGPMERYFYMKKQKRNKHEINIYDI